jgi:hypothetical protein
MDSVLAIFAQAAAAVDEAYPDADHSERLRAAVDLTQLTVSYPVPSDIISEKVG